MKVQQCPACGARYNVARLEDGATFQCRRCQGVVRVGEPVAPRGRPSLGLAVAGLLLIVTTFLRHSPGLGERADWPWERFQVVSSWLLKATFGLWVLAGVWALFASLVPSRGLRAGVSLVLAAGLAVLCTSPVAGFTIETVRLPQFLAMAALAAGLLLAPAASTARLGRVLALVGGLVLVTWHVVRFHEAEPQRPEIYHLFTDLVAAVKGDTMSNPSSDYLWQQLAPQWIVLAASAFGILAGLGVRGKGWCLAGFFLVLGAILLPAAVRFGREVEELDLTVLRSSAIWALVGHGLAVWALGCAAVVDLARTRTAEA